MIDTLSSSNPNLRVSLEDLTIRERQMERHLLRSPEYLQRADREVKRQVAILYLAIAILIVFQGLFAWRTTGRVPTIDTVLTSLTAFLAIINCLLLIRTKACLRRLNEAWLSPAEKKAVDALRTQRREILLLCPDAEKSQRAELN